jgi:hypothetical protein
MNHPVRSWLHFIPLRLVILCALLAGVPRAWAHKPSDSYLTLWVEADRINAQWDIALRDLDIVIGLDENYDGAITWGELQNRQKEVDAYALERLGIRVDGIVCAPRVTKHEVASHVDGAYTVIHFTLDGLAPPQTLEMNYRLFADVDPLHCGMTRVVQGEKTQTAIFSPANPTQKFDLASAIPAREFATFVRQGVWHIWIGFDHILFLVALLLPSVLRREGGRWVAEAGFRPVLINVVKIVTAFTLAHSITLSLAALEVIKAPSRVVESVIAASVVVAALNNLVPLFREKVWLVVFAFGLIHGFGFANVLTDLGLSKGSLALCVVGFNVGVELGQLSIVGVMLPVAFALREKWAYQKLALGGGSAAIIVVASAWMVERVFDLKFMPF